MILFGTKITKASLIVIAWFFLIIFVVLDNVLNETLLPQTSISQFFIDISYMIGSFFAWFFSFIEGVFYGEVRIFGILALSLL